MAVRTGLAAVVTRPPGLGRGRRHLGPGLGPGLGLGPLAAARAAADHAPRTRAAAMPAIHESLASAIPSGVGRGSTLAVQARRLPVQVQQSAREAAQGQAGRRRRHHGRQQRRADRDLGRRQGVRELLRLQPLDDGIGVRRHRLEVLGGFGIDMALVQPRVQDVHAGGQARGICHARMGASSFGRPLQYPCGAAGPTVAGRCGACRTQAPSRAWPARVSVASSTTRCCVAAWMSRKQRPTALGLRRPSLPEAR